MQVPGHSDVIANSRADDLVKLGTGLPLQKLKMKLELIKPLTSTYFETVSFTEKTKGRK